VDYILFIQADVTVVPNPNEVQAVRWFSQPALKHFVATAESEGLILTPWFQLIGENFLYKWWNAMPALDGFEDTEVHKLGTH
jgi:isopentenyl-diphosphate delta-isomerase